VKLDKDALVKLIKEVHLQELSREDLEHLGGKPNSFHVYGFFDDGTGVFYSAESNIKLALDSACKYRNEDIIDTLKGRNVSAYRIIIQCPKDDDDFPLGKTSFTVFGGKKKNNAWRHFEIVKGSCGKDKWVANTIPPGYYSACGEPAIAESKDYKRLASKWLTEKRKISAEKNSRILLSEAQKMLYSDGEWRVWKVNTVRELYDIRITPLPPGDSPETAEARYTEAGRLNLMTRTAWFPEFNNSLKTLASKLNLGRETFGGNYLSKNVIKKMKPENYIKLIGHIPIDCHVFYHEKTRRFAFALTVNRGDVITVGDKMGRMHTTDYMQKTGVIAGQHLFRLYNSYVKRVEQINQAIDLFYKNRKFLKSFPGHDIDQKLRVLVMRLHEIKGMPGDTWADWSLAGNFEASTESRTIGGLRKRSPLADYRMNTHGMRYFKFLTILFQEDNFQKFKSFMAMPNPLYVATKGKKGKSWRPVGNVMISPTMTDDGGEFILNMLLNQWRGGQRGSWGISSKDSARIQDLLKRIKAGATGRAPRGSVSISQQPAEKGALTVVDAQRGQLSVTDKVAEELTEQVSRMLLKRLINRFFTRPKNPRLPPPDKKKMQQHRAAMRTKADRSSREIVNWMRNARNAARIVAIIKSVGGAAAAGKAIIVIGGFALTAKFVYETWKALTDPERDFKSAKFDSRDYPVPTKKAESDYQDVGPCPEDGC